MMSTKSTSERTYSMAESGVPGFKTTPAMQPMALIWPTVRCRWMVDAASQCTEIMSAPAFAKSSTRCSGSTIMRWQSRIASGCAFRKAATTPGPMVMFGTKRPSMTSTCTQSAPALSTFPTSCPSWAKLAERIEGETFTVLGSLRILATLGFSARKATTLRSEAVAVLRRRKADAVATPAAPTTATVPADDQPDPCAVLPAGATPA
mmetsp:Transcript_63106/g.112162  ORF Transcript_63106/g.112162 Transcript_63106/m.112162 type:complete len:206 (+) Transcript_63106:169-786(+)